MEDTAQQGSSKERPLCRATSKAPVVPFSHRGFSRLWGRLLRSGCVNAGVAQRLSGNLERQQSLDLRQGIGLGQLGKDITQIILRLYTIGLGGLDQAIEVRGRFCARWGIRE